jgi:hypothetical protein
VCIDLKVAPTTFFRTDVSQQDSYRHNQPPLAILSTSITPRLVCCCWPLGKGPTVPFGPRTSIRQLLLVRTLSITSWFTPRRERNKKPVVSIVFVVFVSQQLFFLLLFLRPQAK